MNINTLKNYRRIVKHVSGIMLLFCLFHFYNNMWISWQVYLPYVLIAIQAGINLMLNYRLELVERDQRVHKMLTGMDDEEINEDYETV